MARNDRKVASQPHRAHRKNVTVPKKKGVRAVIVAWKDHYAVHNPPWITREEITASITADGDSLVLTMGWIVCEDSEHLVVAQSLDINNDTSGDHMVIYKALIVKMWTIGTLPYND